MIDKTAAGKKRKNVTSSNMIEEKAKLRKLLNAKLKKNNKNRTSSNKYTSKSYRFADPIYKPRHKQKIKFYITSNI